jgi:hypothetical protein
MKSNISENSKTIGASMNDITPKLPQIDEQLVSGNYYEKYHHETRNETLLGTVSLSH